MLARVIWLLFSVIFGSVAVLFAVQVSLAYTSRNWPTTSGIVVAFYETPEYKYSVAGTTYTNSCASCNELFDRNWSIRNSSKYAVRYPLGAKVDVHYSPKRPGVAVLETKFDRSEILIVLGLVLATSVCVAGVVFGWRFRGRLGSAS